MRLSQAVPLPPFYNRRPTRRSQEEAFAAMLVSLDVLERPTYETARELRVVGTKKAVDGACLNMYTVKP